MNQDAENILNNKQVDYKRSTTPREHLRIKKNIGFWTTKKLKALTDEEFEDWRNANRVGPFPDRYQHLAKDKFGQMVPWFHPGATEWLMEYLPKHKGLRVLDFGCGGTTMFTSDYTDNMITIDHPTTEMFDNTSYK